MLYKGADMLVFPELVLTGYDIGPNKLRSLARPLVGKFVTLATTVHVGNGPFVAS